jgi:hypothetical protein
MVLVLKSAATNTTSAVTVTFGNYQKVTGASVGLRAVTTAVATKLTIATNVVTVTPAADPGAGYYDVVADCI